MYSIAKALVPIVSKKTDVIAIVKTASTIDFCIFDIKLIENIFLIFNQTLISVAFSISKDFNQVYEVILYFLFYQNRFTVPS
jgi:hypothetical protein